MCVHSAFHQFTHSLNLICKVTIDFPNVGDGPAKWKYYFNDSLVYSTGDKVTITDTPLNEYPVFVATSESILCSKFCCLYSQKFSMQFFFKLLVTLHQHDYHSKLWLLFSDKILPLKTTKGGQVQGRAGEREAGGWDIKWSLYLSKGGREDGDSFKLRETHGSGMIAIYRFVNCNFKKYAKFVHKSLSNKQLVIR